MIRAFDIEAKLASKYLSEQAGWAFLREVTIGDVVAEEARRTAFDRMPDYDSDPGAWRLWRDTEVYAPTFRRIDVLLMKTSATAKPVPFERIAVEIKISRGDFFRDTEEKRRAWHAVAHRFAYATPPGLVRLDEVPVDCGLIEVDPSAPRFQGCAWAKRAPRRTTRPRDFDDRFVAYLAGRASRAEHQLREVTR